MEEKTKVVVSRSRRTEGTARNFGFTADMLPKGDVLESYRKKAWQSFTQLPFPNIGDEAWRRTDIQSLPVDVFRIPVEGEYHNYRKYPKQLLDPLTGSKPGSHVILVPGGALILPDQELVDKGVVFLDLKTACLQHPDLIQELFGKVVRSDEGKFESLVDSLTTNGILLYVPKGVRLEKPLTSLLWGSGSHLAHLSHILVVLDENASATYVHECASPEEKGPSFHAGIIEITVRRGASLRFVEMQSWGRHVWNFTRERIRIENGGSVDWIFGAVGSKLTKTFSTLDLAGAGASARFSGFCYTDGNQHLDHDTQQNHLAPNTTSDLFFKGALQGHSRSVWQGMIYVAPGADKTDGYQANRNLVLSPEARADSIPGLEILADDVRCTHGATVGRLEEEPLFYALTRGIDRKETRRLLVEGFFDPIMQRIPFNSVLRRFQKIIREKNNKP
jgi:Fe-S cluster assembly protein SufD